VVLAAKHSAPVLCYLMIPGVLDLMDTLISKYDIKTLIWLAWKNV